MFGSKIDLLKTEWLDVVFAHKNKKYGAYELRKESSAITTRALFIASAIFVLVFIAPKILSVIKGKLPEDNEVKQVEVVGCTTSAGKPGNTSATTGRAATS
ncbi:hypothetical protein [Pedobacter heparinus]|uniref:Energy transducer TonB n=1 Tax=Pedobacter heparinus (strain ATCC 13125 / DSM 2366 / CIP 104194 / JCM 7457 / NBRC 12017 / NCIMB 9290 / NRRL B-14731 / HIM 762-3) TaxID=485917 RepID=C6XWI9_PEDHD|nr:hypothetical protein Phep_4087 [Pedobacter heparinus DSM 2366]